MKEPGLFERCLLDTFVKERNNFHDLPRSHLDFLFNFADAATMRTAGDALPGPGPYRLYRGIAGSGRSRRHGGHSWTDSLDVACWFAKRWDLKAPWVLTALVPEDRVLAYTNDRGEREFLCRSVEWERLEISPEELERRVSEYLQSRGFDEIVRMSQVLTEIMKDNPDHLNRSLRALGLPEYQP